MILICVSFCTKGPDKVLVIFSYHPEYEWCQQELKGIQEVFSSTDVVIETFYMDTKRRSDESWKKEITESALDTIKKFKPDVVIVCDDNACQLVASQFINKKLPFVFTGINEDPQKYGMPAKNITGVLERNLINGTIGLLRELDPSIQSIAIITDNSTTSNAATTRFTQDNFPVTLKKVYSFDYYDDWKSTVKELNEEVDALGIYMYFTLKEEGSERNIPSDEVLRWTINNTSLPTFSFEEFSVKNGVLCGETQSGYEHGKEAALMAEDILKGTNPHELPLRIPTMGTMLINKRTADKLHISIPDELQQKAKIIE